MKLGTLGSIVAILIPFVVLALLVYGAISYDRFQQCLRERAQVDYPATPEAYLKVYIGEESPPITPYPTSPLPEVPSSILKKIHSIVPPQSAIVQVAPTDAALGWGVKNLSSDKIIVEEDFKIWLFDQQGELLSTFTTSGSCFVQQCWWIAPGEETVLYTLQKHAARYAAVSVAKVGVVLQSPC